jgi:transcriptional regulator NrdR family protein
MSDQPSPHYPNSPSEAYPAELHESARGRGTRACLIGCLIVFVIGLCLCGGVASLLYMNRGKIREIAADAARQAIVSGIQESDLDEEEKEAVIAEIDQLVARYKSGEITTEQLGRVMDELAQSRLMGVVVMVSIQNQHIEPSGLTAEEKQQAKHTMQRVLRGVFEEKIQQAELEDTLDYVMPRQTDGSRTWRDSVSDDDLRAFLAELSERADAAGIPEEPFEVKISEEFRQAVARALAEG